MQSLPDARVLAHPFSVTCHGYSPQNVVTKHPIREDVSPVSKGRNGRYDEPKAKAAPSAEAAGDGVVAGLVSSQTSGTSCAEVLRVDREASRLRRLRSSVLTAARLHVQQRPRWRVAMLTLTYRDDVEWASGQVSGLVRHLRQWLARKGVAMRHVWVQEFTKRGRPHYHMLLWLPLRIGKFYPDDRGWWPWGMTRFEWARNAVGYIAKYASKGDSLHMPAKGARMHGSGGLTEDALLEQRWWKLPTWLRGGVEPSDRVRRAPSGTGGGFVHPDTGEVYRSPWGVFFKGGYVWIYRKAVV